MDRVVGAIPRKLQEQLVGGVGGGRLLMDWHQFAIGRASTGLSGAGGKALSIDTDFGGTLGISKIALALRLTCSGQEYGF